MLIIIVNIKEDKTLHLSFCGERKLRKVPRYHESIKILTILDRYRVE